MSTDPTDDLVSRRMQVLAGVLGAVILAGILLFFLFRGDVKPVMVMQATHTTLWVL